MLEVEDLHVRYGTTHAVRGITFSVPGQGAVALLGANGAGKTSTLRALSGLCASTGAIRFDGEEISGAIAEEVARRGLVHVPEGRRLFGDLSVHENLQIGMLARSGRPGGYTINDVYDLFPALVPLRKRLGFALSGGEQQMVAIGRALVGAPRLLMVDEPSLGLAPIIADALADALLEVSKGIALLVVEQNTHLALRVCGTAIVLSEGTIRMSGDAAEMHQHDDLVAAYLGQSTTGTGV